MSKLDKAIEEALDAEDRAIFAQYGEQGLFAQVGGLFTGSLGFVNAMSAVAQVALFIGALYAATQFLAADALPAMVRWGALSGLLMLAVGFIKLMQWEQMQANRIIREVKRIELQLARSKAA